MLKPTGTEVQKDSERIEAIVKMARNQYPHGASGYQIDRITAKMMPRVRKEEEENLDIFFEARFRFCTKH